jgi:hypothetical protein
MTPLWRLPFDAIERPLTAFSESWVQSDTFMDATAVAFRVRRRLTHAVQPYVEQWLNLCGMPSRSDAVKVSNQVASLERQVRELRQELRRQAVEQQVGRGNGAPAQQPRQSRGSV